MFPDSGLVSVWGHFLWRLRTSQSNAYL